MAELRNRAETGRMRRVETWRWSILLGPEGQRPPWWNESENQWVAHVGEVREDVADALVTLAGKGCDLSFLVTVMKLLGSTSRPRLSRDELILKVQELRQAAEAVRCLRDSDLGFKVRGLGFNHMEALARDLEGMAEAADAAEDLADARGNHTRDDLVAAISRHVQHSTGDWHDEEVSLIVGTAGDIVAYRMSVPGRGAKRVLPRDAPYRPDPLRRDYGAAAHAQWRARHRKLLSRETEFEKWWREQGKTLADGKEPVSGH